MKRIGHAIKRVLFGSPRECKPEVLNCKEYMDRKIQRIPGPLANGVFRIDQHVACLERIPGILDPLEGYALFELAKGSAIGEPIAEVGSYLGKSTSYLALGSLVARNQGVVAVDMFPAKEDWFKGEDGYWHIRGTDYYIEESVYREREYFFYGGNHYQNTLDIFTDIGKRVGLDSHITPFKGNSTSYMESLGKGKNFRLAFIDGDHTYQGVKKDIEALRDAIVSGGYMCFHDYGPSFPGVVKAVDELILSSAEYTQRCLIKSLMVAKKQ